MDVIASSTSDPDADAVDERPGGDLDETDFCPVDGDLESTNHEAQGEQGGDSSDDRVAKDDEIKSSSAHEAMTLSAAGAPAPYETWESLDDDTLGDGDLEMEHAQESNEDEADFDHEDTTEEIPVETGTGQAGDERTDGIGSGESGKRTASQPVQISASVTSAKRREAAAAGGVDLSRASPLEQAIVRHIQEHGSEPVLLSYLASIDHFRTLALMRKVELKESYFRQRPDLFLVTQDDQQNICIGLVRHQAKEQSLPGPSSSSSGVEGTSPGLTLTGIPTGSPVYGSTPRRQQALKDLVEHVVSFIRSSEQPVVLCRFAAHESLKKLARLAGVELKKSFFIERPSLFAIQEETSGNARIWLAGSRPPTSDINTSVTDKKPETVEQITAQTETSDPSTVLSTSSTPAQPATSQAPLTMVDAGILFVYRQTKGGKQTIALNLFGIDPGLAKLAAAEGSAWRRPFFAEHQKFFKYHIVRSAASIALTELAVSHARQLVESNEHAQQYMKRGTLTFASPRQVAFSSAQLLEKKVAEFIRSETDQVTYLHTIAADPQLRKLAVTAEEALKKPYFESRPHLFRLIYRGESTILVTLASNTVKVGGASAAPPQAPLKQDQQPDPVLWIQLQKEIDKFLLEGNQRHYLLASVGNQPEIRRIANLLKIRVGKEYFLDRRRQYVIVDPDTNSKAKAMLVGLLPSYYHTLLRKEDRTSNASSEGKDSTPSARAGLAYAPDPTMRRMETVAVECILAAEGNTLPLSHLLQDPSLNHPKVRSVLNENFFQRRPHLFSCTPSASEVCIGLPQEHNQFKPLEQTCISTLIRLPGFRSELGSLICGRTLEHLVANYTTSDIRIAKAFFMSRPEMFSVIQRGSRTEVVLTEKYRPKSGSSSQPAQTQEEKDPGAQTPTPQKTNDNPEKDTSEEGDLDEDEIAAWEEELSGAHFYEEDADEEDEETGAQQEAGTDHTGTQSSATSSGGSLSTHDSRTEPRENELSPRSGDALGQDRASSSGYGDPSGESHHPTRDQGFQHDPSSGADSYRFGQPQPWPTQVPGMNVEAEQREGYARQMNPAMEYPRMSFGSFPQMYQYVPYGAPYPQAGLMMPMMQPPPSSAAQQFHEQQKPESDHSATSIGLTGGNDSQADARSVQSNGQQQANTLSHISDEQLDEAEERLLVLAPSLAYALRRKRGGGVTERMVDSLQPSRLRSELLLLQLRTKLTLLSMEEDYCGSLQEGEAYVIRVIIHGKCYGQGKGPWKVARVEAMIDAAARLCLEVG